MKNTHNISLNYLITTCKPPTCSNTTTHHKSNFQHHKYRVLQVFKSNKILFITSNQQNSFTFARNEKHSQYVIKPLYNTMQATSLLQHNNSSQNNFQHHKYRVLQVFKSNKILFVTSNQQYSFTFVRIEKHFQYVFKPPYNTMQATRLLQHNNSSQNQFLTS